MVDEEEHKETSPATDVVVNPERPRNQSRSGRHRREEFYLRYYVGHKGKFGHEFLEFEF